MRMAKVTSSPRTTLNTLKNWLSCLLTSGSSRIGVKNQPRSIAEGLLGGCSSTRLWNDAAALRSNKYGSHENSAGPAHGAGPDSGLPAAGCGHRIRPGRALRFNVPNHAFRILRSVLHRMPQRHRLG